MLSYLSEFLIGLLALFFFFILGKGLSKKWIANNTFFSNTLIGLLFIVFTTAVIKTSGQTIFLLFFILTIIAIIRKTFNKVDLKIDNSPDKSSTEFVYFGAFYIINFLAFSFAIPKDSLVVIHHDFLFYIDIAWFLDQHGTETIITDVTNSSPVERCGYHYFLPWLIIFFKKITGNSIISFNILNYIIFPILTTMITVGVYEFLKIFSQKNILRFLLSFLPLLTFALFLPFYKQIPLLEYGDRFNYGIYNSYFGGKGVVNALFILPILISIYKNNLNISKLILGLLATTSMINVPLCLTLIILLSTYEVLIKKSTFKSYITDCLIAIGIFLFFQLWYSQNDFIPTNSIIDSIFTIFKNPRTPIILIIEALLQLTILFVPILLFILIHIRRVLFIKKILSLNIIIACLSSTFWILFFNVFGSPEFFKVAANSWLNLSCGLISGICIIYWFNKKKYFLFTLSFVFIYFLAILPLFTVPVRNRVLSEEQFHKEVKDLPIKKGELLLSFMDKQNEFVNLPGQLNPFVHYLADELYKYHDDFFIISGSKSFHTKSDSLIANHSSGKMLTFDPLYKQKRQFSKTEEETVLSFIKEQKIRFIITEKDIPVYLENQIYSTIKNRNNTIQIHRLK